MQINKDELIKMGNHLKEARLSKQLTQEELARLSNMKMDYAAYLKRTIEF